ncbi:hybrid sensor histidine kinase/response regulator [Azospirillum isscasi]|uniref:histidine kinase n=1 Tax=Azospirillum isscasi TaxID=3053926 RepID=A0ABU0WE00_9PROT|nr:PAS domain-containing sensor histidine kinase [Azospirillum isscasi]MDQ2102423.1 ATP-binding protein [Azospirillum isscasi]
MRTDPDAVEAALDSARLAVFRHEPDWSGGPGGIAGDLEWIGCRYGVDGIDGQGLAALLDAVTDSDRDSLLGLFALAGGAVRGGEFRLKGAGRDIHLSCDALVESGATGRPLRITGTIQDISERRRFEETLNDTLRAKQTLLAIIDACPVSISVADARQPDVPLVYVNRRFQSLTGYEPAETLGRNCRFLQGPGTDPETAAAIRRAVAGGERIDTRILNYRKDGTPFVNELLLAPIRDGDGAVTAYIGFQSDVTEEARREEAERQRQRMEVMGRMMGGVAHEINNLLQPITLLTQELSDRHPDDADAPYLDMVLDCARKARRIIGDLLAFSRPGTHMAEPVTAGALVAATLPLVCKAVGPGVVVNERTDDAGSALVLRADRTAFAQVLLNLAGNAAAAMGGTGAIAVTLGLEPADGAAPRRARITVADTGCGMEPAVLERAFEPFFTTKPVGQGTGLGLSVAYGLVKEMGGDIALSSTPGAGTVATLLLPEFEPPATA